MPPAPGTSLIYRKSSPSSTLCGLQVGSVTAGLDSVRVRSFVGEAQEPLTTGERIALTDLFEMLWGQRQNETSSEDWDAFLQLCDPTSPNSILDQPGYYAYFTYTLFEGIVPQ